MIPLIDLSLIVSENVIRYSAPRAEIRDDVNLEDISYDGKVNDSSMNGGLGQLVDGLYGDDDYEKQLQGENSGRKILSYHHIQSCNF